MDYFQKIGTKCPTTRCPKIAAKLWPSDQHQRSQQHYRRDQLDTECFCVNLQLIYNNKTYQRLRELRSNFHATN
jgi:hypothetical protein